LATAFDPTGKWMMESIRETKAETILQFICGLRGDLQVTEWTIAFLAARHQSLTHP
jgi:hypothetical protein